jgi:hypothetical protein
VSFNRPAIHRNPDSPGLVRNKAVHIALGVKFAVLFGQCFTKALGPTVSFNQPDAHGFPDSSRPAFLRMSGRSCSAAGTVFFERHAMRPEEASDRHDPRTHTRLANSARISLRVMSDLRSTRLWVRTPCASMCPDRRFPPNGLGATKPAFRISAAQRIALAALTPKRTAARHDDQTSIAATTRSRKSTDSALDLPISPMPRQH